MRTRLKAHAPVFEYRRTTPIYGNIFYYPENDLKQESRNVPMEIIEEVNGLDREEVDQRKW